jgi:hypothetical protein
MVEIEGINLGEMQIEKFALMGRGSGDDGGIFRSIEDVRKKTEQGREMGIGAGIELDLLSFPIKRDLEGMIDPLLFDFCF